MFDQFQTNKNTQNYTDTDPQGNIVTYDMMTYDNPDMTYDNADGSGGYTGGFDSSTQNYNDPYSPGDTE